MTDYRLNLSKEHVDGIVNFLGYGNPSSPVWFIGFEEGLGKMGSEDAHENLTARAKFEKTMDLYEAHLLLKEGGKKIDFKEKLPSTPVWRYMAKIMFAYNGSEEWSNRETAKEYVRCRLGRFDGETFLTELSPIPKRKTDDKELMTLFRELDPELDSRIERRKDKLKQNLKKSPGTLVICYGRRRKTAFEELLGIKFSSTNNPKVDKAQDAKHLLLPFFGRGMSHSVIEYLLDSGLLGKSK